MQLIPATNLKDLDETDIETLLPFYTWFANTHGKGSLQAETNGGIVYRDGKPYRKVTGGTSELLNKLH
jgi:hypothetical protein